MWLHSLRSGKILRLLIHGDLPTSVVFGTGISSSLRPVLLWWEQDLLILFHWAHLSIHLSVYPCLPHFPLSCLSCLLLPLSDTYSTRVITLGESCSYDWTWLTWWIRHYKLKHTHWGWAAVIDHWATALKYNDWIQSASSDGYLPSVQIFDTQSRTLVELVSVLFVTSTLLQITAQSNVNKLE